MNKAFYLINGMLWILIISCTEVKMVHKFRTGTPVYNKDSCRVAIHLIGHRIYLPVTINNSATKYRFIMDTGALTMIDESLADELKIDIGTKVPTGTGSNVFITRKYVTISVGDMQVTNFIPIVTNLRTIVNDTSVKGFIGSDWLRFFQVMIDYKDSCIVLMHPDHPVNIPNAYEITMYRQQPLNFPLIKCKVGKVNIYGMLDTGSPFGIVLPMSMVKHTLTYATTVIKSKGLIAKWPFTAPTCNYLARIKCIKLDTITIYDIPVLYAEMPKNLPYMLIGKEILDKFLLLINYPKNKVWMSPYKNVAFKHNVYSVGIALEHKPNNVVVQGVWEGSSADVNGIQPGDTILEINSMDVSQLTPYEMERMLYDDTVHVITLHVKGAQGERTLTLTKSMLLPE